MCKDHKFLRIGEQEKGICSKVQYHSTHLPQHASLLSRNNIYLRNNPISNLNSLSLPPSLPPSNLSVKSYEEKSQHQRIHIRHSREAIQSQLLR